MYKFELWGSPGGLMPTAVYRAGGKDAEGELKYKRQRGYGGYTVYFSTLSAGQKIYCYVGGTGAPSAAGAASGGWNGGGCTMACTTGPHSSSGGGASHVSKTQNEIISDTFVKLEHTTPKSVNKDTNTVVYGTDGDFDPVCKANANGVMTTTIDNDATLDKAENIVKSMYPDRNVVRTNLNRNWKTYGIWFIVEAPAWNTTGTLAVAGGGGGTYGIGHDVGGQFQTTHLSSDGGGVVTVSAKARGKVIEGCSNEDNNGFRQGAGQSACAASGGGGGWYAGRSWGYLEGTANCCIPGSGGTGYFDSSKETIGMGSRTESGSPDNVNKPKQPNSVAGYWNYNVDDADNGGYIRITRQ